MHLEDISRMFGLLHLEIFCKVSVELRQQLIGNDLSFFLIEVRNKDLLPGSIKS